MADTAPRPYLSFIGFLVASTLVAVMAVRAPPAGCATRELLLLSPCLPFISAPPNNLSDAVPSACCEAFSSAYDSNGGICLCYFLRDPQILGFPLNKTKLISLSSFCPLRSGSSEENGSLNSLCSGPQKLPPLQTSKIPGIQQSDGSAGEDTSPPAPATSPLTQLEPANKPPSPSSATAEGLSAPKDYMEWSLPGLLIFLVHFYFNP